MKLKTAILGAALFLVPAQAFADANIEAVPNGWRLQNYVGGNVVLYYTGTSCSAGSVLMPSSATAEEKNRFFALIMTAKATGKAVGIYYETTSGTCQITSFYAP